MNSKVSHLEMVTVNLSLFLYKVVLMSILHGHRASCVDSGVPEVKVNVVKEGLHEQPVELDEDGYPTETEEKSHSTTKSHSLTSLAQTLLKKKNIFIGVSRS